MATQANQTVHTGCTVLLKVNGNVVGRAQSLDARRSFGTEGVYEIGSIMPQEHINNRYEGSVTMERFLIKTGDLAKIGMAAMGEEILTTNVIDIEVISKADGSTIRCYRGCTCVDYSENFRVGAICGENATWNFLSSDNGTAIGGVGTIGGGASGTIGGGGTGANFGGQLGSIIGGAIGSNNGGAVGGQLGSLIGGAIGGAIGGSITGGK